MSDIGQERQLMLIERFDIIRRYESEGFAQLAREYNVSVMTICEIVQNKEEIDRLACITRLEDVRHKALSSKVEVALFFWCLQQRMMGSAGSLTELREQWQKFHKIIKGNELQNIDTNKIRSFKNRYCLFATHYSKLPIDSFMNEFSDLHKQMNINNEQIYSADVSFLFWRVLPLNYSSEDEDIRELKRNIKDKINFVACVNATGKHKLPLFAIGNKDLKNMPSVYPSIYKQTAFGFIGKALEQWFYHILVPGITEYMTCNNLPVKALVVVSNSPYIPSRRVLICDEIYAIFMPCNSTHLLRPNDYELMEIMKNRYKKKLLKSVLAEDGSIASRFNNLDVERVMLLLNSAWNSISVNAIKGSWMKLLPSAMYPYTSTYKEEEDDINETMELLEMLNTTDLNKLDVMEWLANNGVEEYQCLTDDEIVKLSLGSVQSTIGWGTASFAVF